MRRSLVREAAEWSCSARPGRAEQHTRTAAHCRPTTLPLMKWTVTLTDPSVQRRLSEENTPGPSCWRPRFMVGCPRRFSTWCLVSGLFVATDCAICWRCAWVSFVFGGFGGFGGFIGSGFGPGLLPGLLLSNGWPSKNASRGKATSPCEMPILIRTVGEEV